jgi:hypothetical protein
MTGAGDFDYWCPDHREIVAIREREELKPSR